MIKAIVLAAGKGTRMKSKLPKVLHKTAGREMINQVFDILKKIEIDEIVAVLGHGAELVEAKLAYPAKVVLQKEQLGTGHAVMQAADYINPGGEILVICGDTPLFRPDTLKEALEMHHNSQASVTVLTSILENPKGYGRIIRSEDGKNVLGIVEEKDAADEQKEICEINTGTYVFDGKFLKENLSKIDNKNSQGEYYLTDLLKIANEAGHKIAGYILKDPAEALGINDRRQLAQASQILRHRKITQLMIDGVTFIDPDTAYIESQVEISPDVIIYPNVIIEGNTTIGEDNTIGPDTRIIDSKIGSGNVIEKSKILESTIGSHCNIGPYAYLRPGADIRDNVKIGDFVEIKKSVIGEGSKVPHLTYVGDADVGTKVNIGCGTITCNYDGKNKHKTVMKNNSFIGSNTNLVAPVTVGEGAYIGAGSTITIDVPDNHLAIARGRQKNINLNKEKA